jgi:hypothetical protein
MAGCPTSPVTRTARPCRPASRWPTLSEESSPVRARTAQPWESTFASLARLTDVGYRPANGRRPPTPAIGFDNTSKPTQPASCCPGLVRLALPLRRCRPSTIFSTTGIARPGIRLSGWPMTSSTRWRWRPSCPASAELPDASPTPAPNLMSTVPRSLMSGAAGQAERAGFRLATRAVANCGGVPPRCRRSGPDSP